ncbi:MAG: hypothetical protein IT204_10515 [Fimbriimonadaceae bacterium]|nr:hypothetical protein [Fimbriimonadaceae bacterium]
MNAFPTTEIGGLEVSRLIIGSNTFHGFSHFSKARSEWLRRYFTPERIYEVLRYCAEQGLNATVSMQRPDYAEVLRAVEADTGVHIVWFATPGGRDTEELKDGICQAAELGAEFCLPHTMWTDARLLPARGIIEEAEEVCAFIRAQGMRPGWSSHRPEVVSISDKMGYDIDVYIQIFNSEGFLMHLETDWEATVIRNAKLPCLCIKPLGSGRVMPPTGLSFVYHNIKPVDTVAIGMMSLEEAREDINLARQILAGQTAEAELQYTRSKAVFAAD